MNNQNQFQPINVILANTFFYNGVQAPTDQTIANPPQLPPNIFIAQNIPYPLVSLAYNNDHISYNHSYIIYKNLH